MKEKAKKPYGQPALARSGFSSIFVMLVLAVLTAGGMYLFQVNSLATKGFEIRDVENDIRELKKQAQQYKIKELELRSMYAIEKAMENTDLVASEDPAYAEIESPYAMK